MLEMPVRWSNHQPLRPWGLFSETPAKNHIISLVILSWRRPSSRSVPVRWRRGGNWLRWVPSNRSPAASGQNPTRPSNSWLCTHSRSSGTCPELPLEPGSWSGAVLTVRSADCPTMRCDNWGNVWDSNWNHWQRWRHSFQRSRLSRLPRIGAEEWDRSIRNGILDNELRLEFLKYLANFK